ncbi:MFS transporter [Methylacidimicrobium sp. AP8]|uniref:MFS transporter n=1 Tax=Methylacidimicrobium sp. AP8 TaxID=2730359 RepID=UPI001921F7DF|nr:MFS transporter [Methylacidimicrobium sp. AP8]
MKFFPQPAPFRSAAFRMLFFGQAASFVGSWVQNVGQGWLVYQMTGSPFWLGLFGFAGSLPLLLFSLPAGALADRFARKRIVILAQTAALFLASSLGLLAFLHLLSLPALALIVFGLGLAGSFELPARQALFLDVAPDGEIRAAVAWNSVLFNGARLIGPAIAAYVIPWLGVAACFWINALSYLISLACLFRVSSPPRGSPDKPVLPSFGEAFRYLTARKPLLGQACLIGLVTIFGWSYTVLLPFFAESLLHSGPKGLGLLISANGAGSLVGGLAAAGLVRRFPLPRLVFVGLGLFLLSAASFAVSRLFFLSMALLALAGSGLVIFLSAGNAFLQEQTAPELRGRVVGVSAFLFQGLFPVGSLFAALASRLWGAPAAVLIGTGLCGLGALGVAAWSFRCPCGSRASARRE